MAAAASATLVGIGLAPAGGQPAAPAAPEAAAFSNGTATATAIVSRVAPGVGSLELALANGVAVSEVTNQLAQAQAETLDLGLIGSTLSSEPCDGGDPTLSPSQMPQPTRVDNRHGDTEATSDEVPLADAALGFGRELARATTVPMANAVATTAASFGPLLDLSGGRAEAVSEVVDGSARQAHATVEATLDIAGVVRLSGLRWDALHRTGSEPRAEASFDIGGAEVLGLPVPLSSLTTLEGVLNQALAPLGVTITFPVVERFEEPADVVRITPLRIVLRDSPVGKAVLSPLLELTREQRAELFNQLVGVYCRFADVLLVGDVATSVLAGTGFLAIEIGGAEATSGELVLENPFGVAGPAGVEVLPPDLLPGVGGAALPGPAVAPVAAAAPEPAPEPVAAIGPLETVCQTIHPGGAPGCDRGALVPLGLLGLAATSAVGALDWRHQRRRSASAGIPPGPGAGLA